MINPDKLIPADSGLRVFYVPKIIQENVENWRGSSETFWATIISWTGKAIVIEPEDKRIKGITPQLSVEPGDIFAEHNSDYVKRISG